MKFIDLFAGIGGIRLGFEDVFDECVFSSEWDKYAQITYEANFGDKPSGDITKIDEKEIPNFDILLAGFPCQPFSSVGLKRGFEDTRGTLFFNIAKIINYHKPKVVFLENVKGLKSNNNGSTFKTIINALEEMGYSVYSKVLNAKDFSVPQNRERIYIVAFLDDVDFSFPEPFFKEVKVIDILEYPVGDEFYFTKLKNYEKMKAGVTKSHSIYQWTRGGVVQLKSGLCPTLKASQGDIPLVKDEKDIRKLTPRECARLQGIPDSFVFPVSNAQAYKQIGNSVCIPVIRALAEQIKKALNNG